MAKKNAINNETQELTIDPGASGDSFIQLDINATGEFRIGVDDTDDSFRISQGSALGTNDTFIMTAAGERTMPLQPAFLAYSNATQSNITGNSTFATIANNTEIFDQNGDYDTGTYAFTAPVAGRVEIFVGMMLGGFTIANRMYIRVVASNRSFSYGTFACKNIETTNNQASLNGSCFVDMDAADTVHVDAFCDGEVADTVDIIGSASPLVTFFGGYLEC